MPLNVAVSPPNPTSDDLAAMFRELEALAAARPRRITDVMLMDYHGSI